MAARPKKSKSEGLLPQEQDLLDTITRLAPAVRAVPHDLVEDVERDRFAAAALTGLIGVPAEIEVSFPELAAAAYKIADAMIAARKAVRHG